MYDTIESSSIRRVYPTFWRYLTFLVKGGHSLIFLSFVFSDIIIVYSGLTGHYTWLLGAAVIVLGIELVVLYYNSWRCPLTKLAIAMGDPTGDDLIADYLMPVGAIKWVTPTLMGFFVFGIVINVLRLVITLLFF